jgi:hypothetical protein
MHDQSHAVDIWSFTAFGHIFIVTGRGCIEAFVLMFRKSKDWCNFSHVFFSYILRVTAFLRFSSVTLNVTFRGPCIVIYSCNKGQRVALFLNFILVLNSECFRQIYCPSSGVLILYIQQMVFVILVKLTVLARSGPSYVLLGCGKIRQNLVCLQTTWTQYTERRTFKSIVITVCVILPVKFFIYLMQ